MRLRDLVPWWLMMAAGSVGALEVPHEQRGSDGAFAPSGASYVVDLGLAATGPWDGPPTVAGQGVYDPEKWAVVFKFSSVNIPAGTTVTFKNHPSRAPVVWLVDGDVTVSGVVILDGKDGDTDLSRFQFSEPGPGGFRGGDTTMAGQTHSSGFGPGGGFRATDVYNPREISQGSYGTAGAVSASPAPAPPTYGSPLIRPLIGGSGGPGEATGSLRSGGGAGGGALALLAAGTVRIDGGVTSRGGTGNSGEWAPGPAGSGGALRIAGHAILGAGTLDVRSRGSGGSGRILIEASDYQGGLQAFPSATFLPASRVAIWPEATAPSVRVVSVSEIAAPADPRAFLGPLGTADITVPPGQQTNVVLIETRNLPPTASVMLRLAPRHGMASLLPAEHVAAGAEPGVELWSRRLVVSPGYFALQVRATVP